MKYLSLIILSILLLDSCDLNHIKVPTIVPREREAKTPTQLDLDNLKPIKFKLLNETKEELDSFNTVRVYHLEGEIYNGWALQIFEGSKHKYRYLKFEDGLISWQIGFYDTGELDHDFHMQDGMNYGSQRMWLRNGHFYIDTYFLEGEIQHGKQYRWYTNNKLAEESEFYQGKLIYRIKYNMDGNLVEHTGQVPSR